eukprot:GHVP01000775.1.p1 GENE.GHVP01000775.1~~GHVP01000775.1.p1  ORF type:complete len:417 (+),score=38.62 GHVP01000775.1:935-2185(+)
MSIDDRRTIFQYHELESIDPLEHKLSSSANLLCSHIPLADIPNLLDIKTTLDHKTMHEGVLYLMLTTKKDIKTLLPILHLKSRTRSKKLMKNLKELTSSKAHKLSPFSKNMLFEIINISLSMQAFLSLDLYMDCIRETSVSDTSSINMSLIKTILNMTIENLDFISTESIALACFVYFAIRVIDSLSSSLSNKPDLFKLLNDIKGFTLSILNKNKEIIRILGKEYGRLLMMLSKMSEFSSLISGIPLSDRFPLDPIQRYQVPYRIEQKLMFLNGPGCTIEHVEWLISKYFDILHNQVYIPEAIRIICLLINPTHGQIGQDGIQRFNIIERLMRCITVDRVFSHAEMALSYDWLFSKSYIMHLEPSYIIYTSRKGVVGLVSYLKGMYKRHIPIFSHMIGEDAVVSGNIKSSLGMFSR